MNLLSPIPKFAKILLGVCALIAALYWLGPAAINAAFDFQAVRTEVARIVREKTGRELHLDGEVHFQLRTLTPGLRLTKVRFENAPWARNPDMLRLDYLDVDLRLASLLFHDEIDLRSVELGEGEVYLETDRSGRGNWELQPPTPPIPSNNPDTDRAQHHANTNAGDDKSGATWLVESLRIQRSTLQYVDGETGRVRELNVDRADLDLSPEKIAGTIALRYGRSDVSGELEFHRKPRAITTKLRSNLLDLDDLLDTELRVRREARARRNRPRPAHEPLPFEDLYGADANIDWSLKKLSKADWSAGNLRLIGELRAGELTLQTLRGAIAGGAFDASAKIRAKDRHVNIKADIQKIDLTRVLQDADRRPLADARLSARIALSSGGPTIPTLRENLRGAIAFESGALTIDEPVFYAAIGSEAASVVKSWATPLPRIECLIARLDFQKGRGVARNLLLDANELSVLGAGSVDLARTGAQGRQLDLVFALHSKRLSVFSLAAELPLHIQGSFAHPAFHVSDADIAKKIFLSALELPLLPADLIASIYDRGVKPGESLCPAARKRAFQGFGAPTK